MRWTVARSLLRENNSIQKEVSANLKTFSNGQTARQASNVSSKTVSPSAAKMQQNQQQKMTSSRPLSSVPLPQHAESRESNINMVTENVPGKNSYQSLKHA